MNSKRQVKEKLGHVVQLWRKRDAYPRYFAFYTLYWYYLRKHISFVEKLNKRPWRVLDHFKGFQNWSFFIDVEVYVLNDLFPFFVYYR